MWYIHMTEYYLAIRRKGVLIDGNTKSCFKTLSEIKEATHRRKHITECHTHDVPDKENEERSQRDQ